MNHGRNSILETKLDPGTAVVLGILILGGLAFFCYAAGGGFEDSSSSSTTTTYVPPKPLSRYEKSCMYVDPEICKEIARKAGPDGDWEIVRDNMARLANELHRDGRQCTHSNCVNRP